MYYSSVLHPHNSPLMELREVEVNVKGEVLAVKVKEQVLALEVEEQVQEVVTRGQGLWDKVYLFLELDILQLM